MIISQGSSLNTVSRTSQTPKTVETCYYVSMPMVSSRFQLPSSSFLSQNTQKVMLVMSYRYTSCQISLISNIMMQTNVLTYGNLKKEMTIPHTVGKPCSVYKLKPFLTLIRNKAKGITMI